MIGVGKTKSTSEKLMSIDRKTPRPKIESLPIYPINVTQVRETFEDRKFIFL